MAEESAAETSKPIRSPWYRDLLALIVVAFSLLGVAVLAVVGVYKGEPAKEVLTMLLPVIGTWVGTVLAFYFGREQLEAANRTVDRLAKQLTAEEKLGSIKVMEKMIPRSNVYVATEDPAQLKLLEAVAALEKEKKNRLPVLTPDGKPRLVVHRSTIDRFIASRAAKGATVDELKALTMESMLQDNEFGKDLKNTFAVIPKTGTMADAKRAMEALGVWCQDVFVTDSGTSAETVLGWITNGIVEQNSKV